MFRIDPFFAKNKYSGYKLIETRLGTYGVVWIFESTGSNSFPQRFAAKTVDLSDQTKPFTKAQLKNFEREIGIWLAIPSHPNVVPALGIDFAPVLESETWIPLPDSLADIVGANDIPDLDCRRVGEVPIVRMPYCEHSLKDWIGNQSFSDLDRCVAVAYLCNGLIWLYKHGVLAHGDLKPDNILVRDLRDSFSDVCGPDWPKELGPWMIRVADVGWANAWIDLDPSYTQKALRQYLAPERCEGIVIRHVSDVFSIGIIAAELFAGHHPAGNLKKHLKSSGSWLRWCKDGERQLSEIRFPEIKSLILSCLDPDADSRPSVETILREISAFTSKTFQFDVERQCRSFTEQASSGELLHASSVPLQAASLGPDYRDNQIDQLENKLNLIGEPLTAEKVAEWLFTWDGLVSLLERRNDPADISRLRDLADRAAKCILANTDCDLRPYRYPGWTNCSLDPREVLYDYADRTIELLNRLTGLDNELAEALRTFNEPISKLYEEIQREHNQLIKRALNLEE